MIAAPVAPRDGPAGIRVQQGGALALDAPFDVGVLRPIETEALRPNVYYPGLDRRVREEFRAPAGVRKSPRNEPAGLGRWLWGFRFSAG
jgi:hypothetical protein